jgi:hypothetical protein
LEIGIADVHWHGKIGRGCGQENVVVTELQPRRLGAIVASVIIVRKHQASASLAYHIALTTRSGRASQVDLSASRVRKAKDTNATGKNGAFERGRQHVSSPPIWSGERRQETPKLLIALGAPCEDDAGRRWGWPDERPIFCG